MRRVIATQRTATPQIDFVVDAPAVLRLGVDGPSVERNVANLIENVARHAPTGSSVRVALTAGQTDVHLSVTDGGPGISPANRNKSSIATGKATTRPAPRESGSPSSNRSPGRTATSPCNRPSGPTAARASR